MYWLSFSLLFPKQENKIYEKSVAKSTWTDVNLLHSSLHVQDRKLISMGHDIFHGSFLVSKVSSSKAMKLVAKSQLHIWILNFVAINSYVTFPAIAMRWFSALLHQAGMFPIFFLYIQLKAFPPENSALHSLWKKSMGRDGFLKSKSCLSLGHIMKEQLSSTVTSTAFVESLNSLTNCQYLQRCAIHKDISIQEKSLCGKVDLPFIRQERRRDEELSALGAGRLSSCSRGYPPPLAFLLSNNEIP